MARSKKAKVPLHDDNDLYDILNTMFYISLGSCRQKFHFSCIEDAHNKSGGIGEYVKIPILLEYPLIAGTIASIFWKLSESTTK